MIKYMCKYEYLYDKAPLDSLENEVINLNIYPG